MGYVKFIRKDQGKVQGICNNNGSKEKIKDSSTDSIARILNVVLWAEESPGRFGVCGILQASVAGLGEVLDGSRYVPAALSAPAVMSVRSNSSPRKLACVSCFSIVRQVMA